MSEFHAKLVRREVLRRGKTRDESALPAEVRAWLPVLIDEAMRWPPGQWGRRLAQTRQGVRHHVRERLWPFGAIDPGPVNLPDRQPPR
jgi:hypothetical protein